MDRKEIDIAIMALWLQYKGLTVESARTQYRVENVAWKFSPPPDHDDLPEISGLMVAT